MELKYGCPLKVEEIKARDNEYEVSGHVSTFGNVDHGYDVVMRGAFDKTLADGHPIRFLFAHDHSQVLGVPKMLKVDDVGLFGAFKISKTSLGEDIHTLLKDGAIDSFSIGYFTRDYEYDDTGIRKLLDIELLEASLVSIPMNDRALVTGVKSDQPFDLLLQQVSQSLGLGLREAEALWARRLSEGREPTESHIDAVKTLLAAVEAAGAKLPTLIAPLPTPEAKADEQGTDESPTSETNESPKGDLTLRLALARRRLTAAGILEKAS